MASGRMQATDMATSLALWTPIGPVWKTTRDGCISVHAPTAQYARVCCWGCASGAENASWCCWDFLGRIEIDTLGLSRDSQYEAFRLYEVYWPYEQIDLARRKAFGKRVLIRMERIALEHEAST